ncbi:Capsular polysaccharide synthesis enzyme Cap5F [hydrothermal vent metagenome]|uniref:Capsular polysaccharide synthesis enzyme Cap5F n=1 Tax=hydrothermal vent metagenome TaxID=652676 RepID=A0A3B0TWQ4_9ZZZZ
MIRVGITGQSGFIGAHLSNLLNLEKETISIVPFHDDYFESMEELSGFVKQCDTIVHLAAMNRHEKPKVMYDTNIRLVKNLVRSCENTNSKPHIIFSSSIQESLGNLYGKSKYDGRMLFREWALKNGAKFTGLVIPNVFGPFGAPYFNSVVATFCHQLTHGGQPQVQIDKKLQLIYINDLCNVFIKAIKQQLPGQNEEGSKYLVQHTSEKNVSEILEILVSFKEGYFNRGVIPNIDNPFKRDLFNTFLCYINLEEYFPVPLKINTDSRGDFVETIKLNSGGQVSFSTTKPGITRGNHFHTRKVERFAVIKGKARIELRKTGSNTRYSFEIDGSQPAYIDIPVWHTHNITNVGNNDLYTIFWVNEIYGQNDPDSYFEEV